MELGECLKTLESHHAMVVSVVYNPDGKTLASGSFDNSIKLWSVELGECLKTLEGHQLTILSLTYSPDGKTLASSSEDRTIRLWDVATGECLLIIKDDLCVDLDITGTIGLTEAQRTALKLMGAIDRDAPDDIE